MPILKPVVVHVFGWRKGLDFRELTHPVPVEDDDEG